MVALVQKAQAQSRTSYWTHGNYDLVFYSPEGFFDKTKVEDLPRRYLFGNSQALLGKINGTAHPSFVQIAESSKPAYMTVINLSGQRGILDAKILRNVVNGLCAILRIVLKSFEAGSDKGKDFERIGFDLFLGCPDST